MLLIVLSTFADVSYLTLMKSRPDESLLHLFNCLKSQFHLRLIVRLSVNAVRANHTTKNHLSKEFHVCIKAWDYCTDSISIKPWKCDDFAVCF